ncbi:hypothetical protein N7481_010931 [Penicillium waksmanii]|uniref:uncharacterized protein n=1 Tax=Penicillium waksmanii TaxID=69791 RepID=UPI0025491C3C|nr:uncharacterized protein N7481_010931 [Penicillium waksmanii]KAJ5973721.1 hypothetical protein N7481_010931 [Penicillium waksmanii]
MDLSSLEGPPIDDPRVVITPDPIDGLVHLRSPTIDSNTNPSRLWRSLPPRPTSRGSSSSYERPAANNNNNNNNNNNGHDHSYRHNYRPSIPRTETSLSEGQLRRTHAQRGRRSPSPEIDMDIDLHMQLRIDSESRVPRFNQRPRSPMRDLIPLPLLSADVPSSSTRQQERGRRTQSCCPLVWVESEQQWIVSESYRQQQLQLQQQQEEEPHMEQSRAPDSIFHRTPLSDPFLGLRLGFWFRCLGWS